MIPIKLTNDTWPPKDGEFCSSIVLYYDNWNDYSYRTSFPMPPHADMLTTSSQKIVRETSQIILRL